jgi:opacity protein-like surface antigen
VAPADLERRKELRLVDLEMKRVIGLSVLLLVLYSAVAFAQFEGTVGVGVHAGYGNSAGNIGAGLHLHYYHTNQLRFSPAYTRYLPGKGVSMWEVDADAHYLIPVTWLFSFYPVAGLNYSNRKFDSSKMDGSDPVDITRRRIGANLGMGLQYDFGYKTRVSFEYRHRFIRDFSHSCFMAGIGFWI